MTLQQTCPRCHKPTIRTKDMGKCGTLFVHADRIENGVPVQDACRISAHELANGLTWEVHHGSSAQ